MTGTAVGEELSPLRAEVRELLRDGSGVEEFQKRFDTDTRRGVLARAVLLELDKTHSDPLEEAAEDLLKEMAFAEDTPPLDYKKKLADDFDALVEEAVQAAEEEQPSLAAFRRALVHTDERAERAQKRRREAISEHGSTVAVTGAALLGLAWGIGLSHFGDYGILASSLGSIAAFFALALAGMAATAGHETIPRQFAQRVSFLIGWTITSLLQAGLGYWIGDSLQFASLLAAVGLVMLVPLWPSRKLIARWQELEKEGRQTPWGLTPQVTRALASLPEDLDARTTDSVNLALEDLVHLGEVSEQLPTHDSIAPEGRAVLTEAADGMLQLCRLAKRTDRLERIAAQRSDDPEARRAAERARARLEELVELMHQTTSAALQLAAGEEADEARRLRDRMEQLHDLAEAQREVEEIA